MILNATPVYSCVAASALCQSRTESVDPSFRRSSKGNISDRRCKEGPLHMTMGKHNPNGAGVQLKQSTLSPSDQPSKACCPLEFVTTPRCRLRSWTSSGCMLACGCACTWPCCIAEPAWSPYAVSQRQHPISTLPCGSKTRMCHPEGPQCACVRHWSCGQVGRALQQLSPFSVAACEPLPSPYQAVQDMIFTGQEQLTGTYHASVNTCTCGLAHACHKCLIWHQPLRRSSHVSFMSAGLRLQRQGRSCWRWRRLCADSCMPPIWSSAWRCRQSSGSEGAGSYCHCTSIDPTSAPLLRFHIMHLAAFLNIFHHNCSTG